MEKESCETCRYCEKKSYGYSCSIDREDLGKGKENLKNKYCFYYSDRREPTLMNYLGWY